MKAACGRIALILLAMVLIDAPGARAEWVKDGVPVCPSEGDQWYAYIAPNGAGGAIITWDEIRMGNNGSDIFCQCIDRAGNLLWSLDGVLERKWIRK